MLAKLLKYEMKSTSRVMWFLYAAVLIVGTIIGIALRVQVSSGNVEVTGPLAYVGNLIGLPQILLFVFIIIYGLLLLALAVMTVIMIIIRFNNNLLKGEGYLMHTLPVPTWMLVLSKLIISIVWMAIGAIASIMSAVLLGLTSGMLTYIIKEGGFETFWRLVGETLGSNSGLMIVSLILSFVVLVLQFYFSMAVGNLVNRNKFLLAVGTFIGVEIVMAIISAVIRTAMFRPVLNNAWFSDILVLEIVLNVIFGAAFYFGTTMILKKRLNLA